MTSLRRPDAGRARLVEGDLPDRLRHLMGGDPPALPEGEPPDNQLTWC